MNTRVYRRCSIFRKIPLLEKPRRLICRSEVATKKISREKTCVFQDEKPNYDFRSIGREFLISQKKSSGHLNRNYIWCGTRVNHAMWDGDFNYGWTFIRTSFYEKVIFMRLCRNDRRGLGLQFVSRSIRPKSPTSVTSSIGEQESDQSFEIERGQKRRRKKRRKSEKEDRSSRSFTFHWSRSSMCFK